MLPKAFFPFKFEEGSEDLALHISILPQVYMHRQGPILNEISLLQAVQGLHPIIIPFLHYALTFVVSVSPILNCSLS